MPTLLSDIQYSGFFLLFVGKFHKLDFIIAYSGKPLPT